MTDQDRIEAKLRELGRRISAGGSIADGAMRQIAHMPVPTAASRDVGTRYGSFTMNRIAKYAAGIAVAAGLFGLLLWQGLGSGGATIAWADVQRQVRQAGAWVFTMTVYQGNEKPMVSRLFFDGKSRTREELDGMVSLIDWETGRTMILATGEKVSYQGTLQNMEDSPMVQSPQNWVEGLKKIVAGAAASELEGREIDGIPVKGWRLRRVETDETVTVWAHARTAALVQVEFETGGIRTVLSDFEHDPQLAESLFSLESPEGYRALNLGPTFDAADAGLDDLVCVLRVWAGGNGGIFPDGLFDMDSWFKAAERYDWSQETRSVNELQKALAQGFAFLGMHRGNWEYSGKGVKLGDAETAIFRFRAPDQTAWQVIYGDLRVETRAEDHEPD